MTRPLFPTVPTPNALGQGVTRYTRPAVPNVVPDLSFDFTYDLRSQIGEIRTDPVTDPLGGILYNLRLRTNADATVAQECLSTLAVQRGWHRGFPRTYGIDYERAMRRPSWGLMVADVENQVVAQLTRIVGVSGVSGFSWRRDGERSWLRMVVQLANGVRFNVEAPVPP